MSFEEATAALADPHEVAFEDLEHPDRVVSIVTSPRARLLLVVTTDARQRTRIISARKA